MSKTILQNTPSLCDHFEDADTAIGYLANTLTPEDAEAYEQHYFACTRCFTALDAIRAAKQSSAATNLITMPARRKIIPWLAIAASVAACATAFFTYRHFTPQPAPVTTMHQAPAAQRSPQPSLALLARFEAPRYDDQPLRGTAQTRAIAFRQAMKPYTAADYPTAARNLHAFLNTFPAYVPARFYAASAELLARNSVAALADFSAVLASHDASYTEEAHWGLANAALLQNNLAIATEHLDSVIQSHGVFAAQATAISTKLKTSPPTPVH